MNTYTFIFFGRSGAGKGTQAKLLKEYLEAKKHKVVYIETGTKVREFMQQASYSSHLVKDIIEKGGLLPEFLPIWMWTDHLIKYVDGTESLILDGLSRRVEEAPVLDSAIRFYNRQKPFVIDIEVSRAWAKQHLLNRGRSDDNEADIDERLDWYETKVLPTIEYFKSRPDYSYVMINGEQSIEKVHQDIISVTRV